MPDSNDAIRAELIACLEDCLSYIDTTWDDNDELPEPQCSVDANELLARLKKGGG